MFDLLVQGNLTYTLPILAAGLVVIGCAVMALLSRMNDASGTDAGDTQDATASSTPWHDVAFQVGLFAFVVGLFSQAVSLYDIMEVVERVGGDISPALVAGGLKLTFIAPAMGMGVFAIAALVRLLGTSNA